MTIIIRFQDNLVVQENMTSGCCVTGLNDNPKFLLMNVFQEKTFAKAKVVDGLDGKFKGHKTHFKVTMLVHTNVSNFWNV